MDIFCQSYSVVIVQDEVKKKTLQRCVVDIKMMFEHVAQPFSTEYILTGIAAGVIPSQNVL